MKQNETKYQKIFSGCANLNNDERTFMQQLFLVPNLISISRLVLILPIALLFSDPSPYTYWIVVALMLISYISDYFDGFFARRLSQQSKLGLILDPVADKVWTAAMIYLLYSHRDLPGWIALIIVLRDLALILMNANTYRRYKYVMPSMDFGRIYMFLLGLMIIGYTLDIHKIHFLANILVVLAVYTLFRYYRCCRGVMTDLSSINQEHPQSTSKQ